MHICDGALSYCEATGTLRWLERSDRSRSWNARFAGKVAGSLSINSRNKAHLTVRINGKTTSAHRLIMRDVAGLKDHQEVDHLNGDATDNRLANLRVVDRSTNNMNIRRQKRNKTGVTGVRMSRSGNRYESLIITRGERIFLGGFDNLFDAAAARKSAELSIGFGPSHGAAM